MTGPNGIPVAISNNVPQNPTGTVCTMSASGVLMIMQGGTLIWSAGYAMRGGACLEVDNDGDVYIIAANGTQTWQSYTAHEGLVFAALANAQAALAVANRDIEMARSQFSQFLAAKGTARATIEANPVAAYSESPVEGFPDENLSSVKKIGLPGDPAHAKTG